MLKASKDVSFLPVAAYAAVIAAPLFEESFFRLFLQGWLEAWLVVISDNWPGDVLAVVQGEAPGPLPEGWRHVADCVPPVRGSGHG